MQYDKLGPGLSSLVETHADSGKQGLRSAFSEMAIVSNEADLKPARISVTLECDPNANFDHLSRYGITVNQPDGSIRTAFLPISSLDELSEEPTIRYIHPARYSNLTMDVAAPAVKLAQFINKTGLTGKNVIIGTVDSGIDPQHPAFKGRILSIWDQTVPGAGVPGIGSYGFEYTGGQIVGSRDPVGHGTHVAGIAAGNDSVYRGIAPEAKLVLVKTDLKDTSIMDGVRYIFAKAKAAGLPAVVNLSLRAHANPHDGTDIISRLMDQQSGPGRIICAAAGNDSGDGSTGGVRLHAEMQLTKGLSQQVIFSIPASAPTAPLSTVSFIGWYSKFDTIEVSLTSPKGSSTGSIKPEPSTNPTVKRYVLDNTYRVEIETPPPLPGLGNGDKAFVLRVSALGSTDARPLPVPTGFWKLRLRGVAITKGTVDVWSASDAPRGNVQFVAPMEFLTDRKKIGAPGSAAQAITVASFTSRTQWTSKDGKMQSASGVVKGTISPFSSTGPLRDGKQKPDVAAPGAFILSALSRDSAPDPTYVVNTYYRASAGTSMSSPFVAGLVALMLQKNSKLTPDQAKQILRKACRIPGKPPGTFDPKWGYGLIDMSLLTI
jgi:subtilisin family serine protease